MQLRNSVRWVERFDKLICSESTRVRGKKTDFHHNDFFVVRKINTKSRSLNLKRERKSGKTNIETQSGGNKETKTSDFPCNYSISTYACKYTLLVRHEFSNERVKMKLEILAPYSIRCIGWWFKKEEKEFGFFPSLEISIKENPILLHFMHEYGPTFSSPYY